MTEHLDSQATAQDLLDALLPRKDPRYEAAHSFLTSYLSTDASTRRLALRALKNSGATSPHAEEESKDAAAQGPAVSPVVDTAGRDPAGPVVDALPPEATGRAESGIGPGTAVAASGNLASASIRPDCGGKWCAVKGGPDGAPQRSELREVRREAGAGVSIDSVHALRVEVARLTRERDDFKALNERSLERLYEAQESLAAARREVEAHKEALSDLMKLINEGALVRNIGQDGEPGWTLRAMRLVMALKHAYALVPELAAPGPAPGEETKR